MESTCTSLHRHRRSIYCHFFLKKFEVRFFPSAKPIALGELYAFAAAASAQKTVAPRGKPQAHTGPHGRLTLFDLDHTLLSGDSGALWCSFLIDRGVLDRAHFAPRSADIEARYKAGTVGVQEFADFYAGTLTGQTIRQWEPLRQEFLAAHIVPRIGRTALALVRQHLDAGDLVILTTAANRFITELTAQHLAIEHLIASEVEAVNGVFTGRTQDTLNMREGKVARLHAWLAVRGFTLDQFTSTAYSDSIHDLPLLQAVDHAVAVNADPRLREAAALYGWQTIKV